MTSVFLLRYALRFFIFKFKIKCEASPLFFQKKPHDLQKKTLYRKKEKIIELHVEHTQRHMQSE